MTDLTCCNFFPIEVWTFLVFDIFSLAFFQTLLQKEFDLIVNETSFRVEPSERLKAMTEGFSQSELDRLGDVRALVGQLYEVGHICSVNVGVEAARRHFKIFDTFLVYQ